MDELAQKLAAAFGLPPETTREQLFAKLNEYIATGESMPDVTAMTPEQMAAAGVDTADVAAMKSFKTELGLADDAPWSSVVAELKAFKTALTRKFDVSLKPGALKSAKAQLDKIRYTAPAMDDEGDADDRGDSSERDARPSAGKSEARAGKSKKLPSRITAGKNGLIGMLTDVRAGKSQSYQIGPAGGYMMRTEIASEFVPALRDAVPLYEMGVDQYDMEGTQALVIPVDTTDEFEAHWAAELTEAAESQERVGGKILFPKPLVANIIVPNKFLTHTDIDYEARVREKVIYRMKRAIMRAALFGSGGVESGDTGASPRGIANVTGIGLRTLLASNGTDGRRPKLDDLVEAVGAVEDLNVEVDESAGWLFGPRTKRTFTRTTDTTGHPLLRMDWAHGEERTLLDYQYHVTNLIPKTATVGAFSDNSFIFFGVWRWLALGLSNQFEFLVDPYTYQSKLATRITAYCYADSVVLRPEAFHLTSGVR